MTLSDWYKLNHGETPMTRLFLGGQNLKRIQADLTAIVRADTGLDTPLQPFTEQILSELMTYAKQFDSAPPTPEALEKLNAIFVQDHRDGLVWNANETNFFKRWQQDAIPDPVNMPYPTLPDNEERNADPSSYLLRHPFGQLLPRY